MFSLITVPLFSYPIGLAASAMPIFIGKIKIGSSTMFVIAPAAIFKYAFRLGAMLTMEVQSDTNE